MPDPDAGADSLFEQLQAEAVGPLHLRLGDGDDPPVWTLAAVDSDGVCELDELHNPLDVVEALVGEDLADEIIDELEELPWSVTRTVAAQIREHFALADLPPGMWAHLVEQLDLYGADIESDLAEHRGADLLDWFRGRRPWPQLARFLTRLPEGSRYHAALLGDEELAREQIEAEQGDDEDGSSRRPPLVGETQGLSLLRAAVSALMRVEHAIYAAPAPKSKRGNPPRPLKGPLTAKDRLLDELGTAEVFDIFDQVTPGWRDDDEKPPAGYRESGSGLLIPDN
ncbi:hypothetical protein GCM10009613_61260 [Pseudonocardia kongjuensis]|uniref:Tail assembly chaperone n=1 Tax=Pseudonocardia kongjuensis TaxID=102227 RepID=A0ABN1Y9Y5_9PSEU